MIILHEYTNIDKIAWGDGPWQNEPDKIQGRDEATGLPCLMVRNTEVTGAWCGYVGVPEGHPAFEKNCGDVDVEVHGGLTFAGFCRNEDDPCESICHIPEPGEPDHVWWLGFDCSHAWDLQPMMNALYKGRGLLLAAAHSGDVYRDVNYVKAEIHKLALQLAKMRE